MNSRKLFAVLAATSLFAACTQEEIVKIENAPQNMEEVVGANLLGTEFTMDAMKGSNDTRYAEGLVNTWDKSDVIGLGWVVTEEPYKVQNENTAPNRTPLYANHLFSWNEEAGAFTSRGNFYEGWHFAYYPWGNIPKAMQKRFVVNPAQKKCEEGQDPVKLRRSQALFLSHLQFMDGSNVTADNSLNMVVQMYSAVNFMNFKTTPVGVFAQADHDFAKKAIKSIEVKVEGHDIFANRLKLDATKLPVWTDEAAEGDESASVSNKKAMQNKMYNGVLTAIPQSTKTTQKEQELDALAEESETWYDVVKTDVSATGYKVSDNTQLITIVAPAQANIAKEDVVITITLDDETYFEVVYVAGAEEGTSAWKNNDAIEKFVAAWGGASYEAKPAVDGSLTVANNQAVSFPIELYGDIYNVENLLNGISNEDEWNNAMDIIDWLGYENTVVAIDAAIEFENGVIKMPENNSKVSVIRAENEEGEIPSVATLPFVIASNLEAGWPAKLTAKDLRVEIADEVVLQDAHMIVARQIVNNGRLVVPAEETLAPSNTSSNAKVINGVTGVIELGYKSTLSTVENEGTIEVVYGSYVNNVLNDKYGKIAYVVTEDDVNRPYQIANVINPTNELTAHVNTLKFHSDNISEFSFTKDGNQGVGDPYVGTVGQTSAQYIAALKDYMPNVNLDITNVAVSSALELAVNNVVMNGAEASLMGPAEPSDLNLDIFGNLTVSESGEGVVVDCGRIQGTLSTDGDIKAELIGGIVKAEDCVVEVGMIQNGITEATNSTINGQVIFGNVKATNSIVVANNINGDITASGSTIKYTDGNPLQIIGNVNLTNSSVKGNFIKGDVAIEGGSIEVNNINADEEAMGDVTVIGGTTAIVGAAISGNLTVEAGTVTANNVTATGNLAVEAGSYTINADEETSYANIDIASGAVLVANNDVVVSTIENYGTVTVATGKTIWYTTPLDEGGFVQEGTTSGKVLYKSTPATPEEL